MKTRSETASKSRGHASPHRPQASGAPATSSACDECPREQMIAEAAYFRAEQRGFEPGAEMSDWLQAEADVETLLGNIH